MCTSATCGGRSKASPRVLTTSWPCQASATASPTPAPSDRGLDTKLAQRALHERSLRDARVRDDKPASVDVLISEQKDVDVDDPGSPALGWHPPSFELDLLGGPEQLTRSARPFDLDHLVQESRLVAHSPRNRFDDAALTQDPRALLTQAPSSRAQVARSTSKV